MRTFFATCGALALMIPVGLLQSENTNAQDGFRSSQRRTVRSFARVQNYNNCSSRNRPAERIRQYELSNCGVSNCGVINCGVINCGVADCDPRLATNNACRSGRCGMAGCSTCQTSRRDFCDSSGNSDQPRRSRSDRGSQTRRVPMTNPRNTPRDTERRDATSQRRPDNRLVPNDVPRPEVRDLGRVQPIGIQWRTDIQAASRESSETGLPILMKFSAKWCGPCKLMKAETFTDPRLAEMINTCFIPVEVDTDQNEQLARQLRIESVPTTMVISPQGDIVERREGFQSAAQITGAIARFCQRPAERPIVRNEPRPRTGR